MGHEYRTLSVSRSFSVFEPCFSLTSAVFMLINTMWQHSNMCIFEYIPIQSATGRQKPPWISCSAHQNHNYSCFMISSGNLHHHCRSHSHTLTITMFSISIYLSCSRKVISNKTQNAIRKEKYHNYIYSSFKIQFQQTFMEIIIE